MSQRPNRPSGPPPADELLAVLVLRKPKGLRGEARCDVLTPEVLDLQTLIADRTFWVRRDNEVLRPCEIESLVPYQETHLITIAGITVREELDEFRGCELCLAREDLPELPEGWFWEQDIVGIPVTDATRGPIGKITGLDTVAGRQRIILESQGGKKVYIPFVPALVPVFDVEARNAETDLPQGFPDLDE